MANTPNPSWFKRTYKKPIKLYVLPPLLTAICFAVGIIGLIIWSLGHQQNGFTTNVPTGLIIGSIITGLALVIGFIFQIAVVLPLEEIFRRNRAHWSLYLITGWALAILALSWVFVYHPLAKSLIFGFCGGLQALATYYLGKKHQ